MASNGKWVPGHPVALTSLCRCTVVTPYFLLRYATSSVPALRYTAGISSLSKLPSKHTPMLSELLPPA